jgi:hypothetical protein
LQSLYDDYGKYHLNSLASVTWTWTSLLRILNYFKVQGLSFQGSSERISITTLQSEAIIPESGKQIQCIILCNISFEFKH